jgi:hypothetical protein
VQVGIGDILPVGAGIGGLPDAAGAGTEVEYRGIDRITGHGDDAPAAIGTDTAPFEGAQELRMDHWMTCVTYSGGGLLILHHKPPRLSCVP